MIAAFSLLPGEAIVLPQRGCAQEQKHLRNGVDPKIPQVRLYTVVVTGTDPLPCTDTFAVLPKTSITLTLEIAICQAFEKRVVY
jgi:hypothetical protein